MLVSKTIQIFESSNMVLFIDTNVGFLQAVPKGAIRVYPFQTPDVGFRFVDIRSNQTIAQINDWAQVKDENDLPWGSSFLDTLQKLCIFLELYDGASAVDISYDNTVSLLTATNVQAAIDEIVADKTESYNFSQSQWGRTLLSPVPLSNGDTANGFTFFSDLTDRVANGCTAYNMFFISFTRKLTLSGNNGTANINVGGVDYLATYNTSLTQTAADFVSTNSTSILSATGIKIASVGSEIRFGYTSTTSLNLITITNVSGALDGTFVASIGDHIIIPYIGEPYEGYRINHNFRVNFDIATGTLQTLALSLRRWADDSVIGSEIPINRSQDVAGNQENFVSYTAGANDPFVTGGFYFALRNNSGANINIDGTVGILIQNYFQIPTNF